MLGELLAEFVAFALPDLHAEVDWSRDPVFLEQELGPLLRQAAAGRRVADVVVQLWLLSGETTWLLAHVEVQGRKEDDFARRMYEYAALLNARFVPGNPRRRRVVAPPLPPPDGFIGIAVLSDSDPAWRPEPYSWGWRDFGLHYRYHVLKLTDWRERVAELIADGWPFGWVVRSWLATQAAGRSIEAQVRARQEVVRRLLAARRRRQLTAEQIVAIVTFLDATGRLPGEVLAKLDNELRLGEEAPMHEVLNRWELRGLERGLEQGQAAGMSEVVIRQLSRKGIALDAAMEARIRGLDRERLLALTEALLDWQQRSELDVWLASNAPQE
ncbi:MAG: DUF4351 domain-containing protein [Chloroflexia bacterium]